jgi:predicted ATP-binding protein involved in virulence
MHLKKLVLRNYRCFRERSFEFASRFNLLVGDNGTGKTSILFGAAFAVGSLFRGFPEPEEPYSLDDESVRTETFWNAGRANVEPQYPVGIECTAEVDGKDVTWHRSRSKGGRTNWALGGPIEQLAESIAERVARNERVVLPVLAFYGTGRVWKQRKRQKVNTFGPSSRFKGYQNSLEPTSGEKMLLEWFKTRELTALQKSAKLEDLEAVRTAVKRCVQGAEDVYWDVGADQLTVRFGDRASGRISRFGQMSDGYRNVLATVADIALRCVALNPQLGERAIDETPGVVLIDEIDLHLHPNWQRHVVRDLMAAFPKVQFIATTHSPFIIQSLPPSDRVRLINLDEPAADDFVNKSVEDIAEEVQQVPLPSRSRRYLEMLDTAKEYYRCLNEAGSAPPERVKVLKDRLDKLMAPFGDDPAYQAFLQMQRAASGIDEEASK